MAQSLILRTIVSTMNTLSIITICFNNLADVQRTCASVDGQSRLPDEHWIINGSTTHDIAEWLAQNPQPAYRKWISEKDKGIYDAINKGINRTNGEIIHILNSGDQYAATDVTAAAMNVFEKNKSIQWLSGKIQIIRGGLPVVIGKPFDPAKLYRGMRSVSHPTWFVKKEVYDRVGPYKEYKIAGDYDMMCRISKEPYFFLDKVLAVFDDSGVSSTGPGYLRSLEENKVVYESHFGNSVKLNLWQLRLKALHYLLQRGIGKWLFSLKKKMGLENM
jgi:glycosyltransferase involved in cell wall biosynthesis